MSERTQTSKSSDELNRRKFLGLAATTAGAMFIDDGIRGLDLLTPPEQGALVGIPWRRVLRIETVVQDAAGGCVRRRAGHGP